MKLFLNLVLVCALMSGLSACMSSEAAESVSPTAGLRTFTPPSASRTSHAAPTEIDLTFAHEMTLHHEQAVRMSDELLSKKAPSSTIADLAEFIRTDQQREIDAMNGWTAAWRKAKPALFAHPPQAPSILRAAGENHGMIASDKEKTLAELGSTTAEVTFLRLMVLHHQGAIAISRELVETGTNDFTLAVAKHILVEQEREVDAMNLLLDQMCGGTRHEFCETSHH